MKTNINEKVYLVIAQYDNHEIMWEVVNNRGTFGEARYAKKAHESEKDCTCVEVYEARKIDDKELD